MFSVIYEFKVMTVTVITSKAMQFQYNNFIKIAIKNSQLYIPHL